MLQNGQSSWTIDRSAALFCSPGAVKEKDGIRFTVSAEDGQRVFLLLYDKKSDEKVLEEPFPEQAVIGGLRTMKVIGLPWRQYAYNFRVEGKIICDPYAALLYSPKEAGVHPQREISQQDVRCEMMFAAYDWKEECPLKIPYEEAVMYHLHVRNFTMHAKSKVRHKGTFRGLQEKIPYLKELGINQVKLMPVYEPQKQQPVQSTRDVSCLMNPAWQKCNYWGYGAGCYFAPRRSYAATQDVVKEFKDMVHAFHENGIEVLLDMFFLPQVSVRMVLDCLTFWVREYHIDGFHLMCNEEIGRHLYGDALLSGTKLIISNVSSWMPEYLSGRRNFAESNDGFLVDMRRILKGDEGMLEAFAYRVRRNAKNYGVINYLTNHDGFTLCDLVSYDNKHNEENGEQNTDGPAYNFSWNCGVEGHSRKKAVTELRKRQMKNAFLLMLLSQGTPMLLAGDEFGNSQDGNNNPYCLDNRISWVDWGAAAKNQEMTAFVKRVIAFRKEHKILHMAAELKMMDYKSCGYPDLSYHSNRAWYGGFEYNSRQLGMLYCGSYANEEEFLYVAYNFHPLAQELALPKLPSKAVWKKVIDTSIDAGFLEEPEELRPENRTVSFPARTIVVLIGRKEGK